MGGLQSGYARHYKTDDAFTVALAGHLVSELQFSIPQARTILSDLQQWLLDIGFYFDYEGRANRLADIYASVQSYSIYVIPLKNEWQDAVAFNYILRGLIAHKTRIVNDHPVLKEHFVEKIHPKNTPDISLHSLPVVKILNISAVYNWFHERLTATN